MYYAYGLLNQTIPLYPYNHTLIPKTGQKLTKYWEEIDKKLANNWPNTDLQLATKWPQTDQTGHTD